MFLLVFMFKLFKIEKTKELRINLEVEKRSMIVLVEFKSQGGAQTFPVHIYYIFKNYCACLLVVFWSAYKFSVLLICIFFIPVLLYLFLKLPVFRNSYF